MSNHFFFKRTQPFSSFLTLLILSQLRPGSFLRLAASESDDLRLQHQSEYFNSLLARYGDFGIGTLNGIDGEMLALDGAFYQVKTDGIPYLIPKGMHTPFATVKFFKADSVVLVPEDLSYPDLLAYLDLFLPSANDVYALKIKCELDSADLRSVPRQHPPYKPLAEVISQEVIFSHTDIAGTLVGFRFPTFLQGVNVPGYHFHFISDDKKSGGHVLNLRINKGTLQIDRAAEFMLSFPDDDAFSNINLSVDRTEDLQKVERNN